VNIRDPLEHIKQIQEGLSVILTDINGVAQSPAKVISVKRAYRYWPDSAHAISAGDTPCFVNVWSLPLLSFYPSMAKGDFIVNMKLLCYDSDSDVAADIASAFIPEIANAFATNLKLGELQRVWVKRLRGGEPTLVSFGEPATGGLSFIGLDLFLDLGIAEAQTMEP